MVAESTDVRLQRERRWLVGSHFGVGIGVRLAYGVTSSAGKPIPDQMKVYCIANVGRRWRQGAWGHESA